MSPEGSRLGLVLDEEETRARQAAGDQAWWLYALEVFDHLRLPYTVLAPKDLPSRLGDLRLLVLPAVPAIPPSVVARVAAWLEDGGGLVLCGDPGTLGPVVGVTAEGTRTEGHVRPLPGPTWPSRPDVDLHGFGGAGLAVTEGAEVWAHWVGEGGDAAAVVAVPRGRGLAVVVGADPWQSIVRIQQGWPVYRDGVPPADGSAPVDEGILKTDDGLALSYETDRALPPGQAPSPPYTAERPARRAAPIFHRPHADLWRWFVLHCVLAAADHRRTVVPWLHYWPAGVPAIGHLSHDSDQNRDDDAKAALDGFAEAGAPATWCHCYPGGYSEQTVAAIAAAGHEQALHYNALGDVERARWGREFLREQDEWARRLVGRRMVSNKNHYLRWEGWTEFFGWCEELGIELDESHGPSKPGNIGFPFGSAHVSFPMAPAEEGNRRYDVLSLPLHTQDLHVFGHESVTEPILSQALEHHGVAHFLFHGANMRPHRGVVDAAVAVVRAGRERGMPWWTAEQINRWERARRRVELSVVPDGADWRVRVVAGDRLDGAGIVVPLPSATSDQEYEVQVESAAGTVPATASLVRRHGRRVLEVAVDLVPGETTLTVRERGPGARA